MHKNFSKLVSKHFQTSNHPHNVSTFISTQLSLLLPLVKTLNCVFDVSLSIISVLNVNNYDLSVSNSNMVWSALPETNLVDFENSRHIEACKRHPNSPTRWIGKEAMSSWAYEARVLKRQAEEMARQRDKEERVWETAIRLGTCSLRSGKGQITHQSMLFFFFLPSWLVSSAHLDCSSPPLHCPPSLPQF